MRLENLNGWTRKGDEAAGDDLRAGFDPYDTPSAVDVLAHLGLVEDDLPGADPAELLAAQQAALAGYRARMERERDDARWRPAKLSACSPRAIGARATAAVLARLARLAMPLSPGVALHLGPAQGDTDLGMTCAQLCAWAQRGELGDWTDHEDAADALLTATEVLYRAPLGDAWDAAVAEACAEDGPADSDPVALVLAAAWSRLRVCREPSALRGATTEKQRAKVRREHSVTLRELARLASLGISRVKSFAADGSLRASGRGGPQPHRVEAAEARRWLASRGLAGW